MIKHGIKRSYDGYDQIHVPCLLLDLCREPPNFLILYSSLPDALAVQVSFHIFVRGLSQNKKGLTTQNLSRTIGTHTDDMDMPILHTDHTSPQLQPRDYREFQIRPKNPALSQSSFWVSILVPFSFQRV